MLPTVNLLLGAKGHFTTRRVVDSSRMGKMGQPLRREGSLRGMQSLTQGDTTTRCVKPLVACLSRCRVSPQPVAAAAAHACMHVIGNTLIYCKPLSPFLLTKNFGPEKHPSSTAKGWQGSERH